MLRNVFKKSRLGVILALALTLCFAGAPAAFATGDPITGSEEAPVTAGITKILKMPVGTITPNSTFLFTATPISTDGDISILPPTIEDSAMTVDFSSADTSAAVDGVISIALETGDIFADVEFPHAGVYVYQIREAQDTNTDIDENSKHEVLTYSKALYTLSVYVKNDTEDNGTYIYAIGAVFNTKDNGNPGAGDKVDPTPGGGAGFDYSQMIFTNTYVKTNGAEKPETPNPGDEDESTLSVSKTVAGSFGSKTQYFDYTISLSLPSLATNAPAFYRAYVVDTASASVVTSLENAAEGLIAQDGGGDYIKMAIGSSTDFSLKDGQKLVFVDTPVGTTYSVNERGAAAYLASVDVFTAGEKVATAAGASVGAPVTILNQLVGEMKNSADFTNTRNDVTPTGLNLADLPFIGMIALAVAALVAFIVAKSRKKTFLEDQA